MDLRRLTRSDLLLLCDELGVDVDKNMKKPAIQKAIKESENDDESIRIAWEVLQDAQKRELEREERLREHERQQQKHEKEMAEIQVEILKSRAAAGIEGDNLVRPSEVEPCRMDQWIKPYKMGEDIALFLVHFERTCERVTVSGPFGDLETEAGVSKALSLNYPYLFSNHSERLLRDRGREFGEKTVQAFTRSPARQIAAQLADETSIGARRKETHSQLEPNAAAEKAKSVIDEGAHRLQATICFSKLKLSISAGLVAANPSPDITACFADLLQTAARSNVA
ncbi:hypothetical protein HPB52_011321 [Rhipicephalus sanguineus]|uniref:Rho termination factor N-terminal domain-containing protein n=1 Tax=Rhipicephalus sanguineus TaxID=34632 RepID=A0A9D4SRA9_RHISA|nr:hypothetical protein HPB52_011321 [Rhipicephalus sanguineus]